MSHIYAKVTKNKRFKDREMQFIYDRRTTGETFMSNPVCLDNDDLNQLELELTAAVNVLLGQIL